MSPRAAVTPLRRGSESFRERFGLPGDVVAGRRVSTPGRRSPHAAGRCPPNRASRRATSASRDGVGSSATCATGLPPRRSLPSAAKAHESTATHDTHKPSATVPTRDDTPRREPGCPTRSESKRKCIDNHPRNDMASPEERGENTGQHHALCQTPHLFMPTHAAVSHNGAARLPPRRTRSG